MYEFLQRVRDSILSFSAYFWPKNNGRYSTKRLRDQVLDISDEDCDDDDDTVCPKRLKLQVINNQSEPTCLKKNTRTQTDDMTRKEPIKPDLCQFDLTSKENWKQTVEFVNLCEDNSNKFKNLYRPPLHVRSPHRVKRKLNNVLQHKIDLTNDENKLPNSKFVENQRVNLNNIPIRKNWRSLTMASHQQSSLSDEEAIKMFQRANCSPKENSANTHDEYSKLLNSFIHNKDSQPITTVLRSPAPLFEIDLTNESSSDEVSAGSKESKLGKHYKLFQSQSVERTNSSLSDRPNRFRVKPTSSGVKELNKLKSQPTICIDDEEDDEDFVQVVKTAPVPKINSLENRVKTQSSINSLERLATQYEEKKSEMEEITKILTMELKIAAERHRSNYNDITVKLLTRHLEITESLLDESEPIETVFPELTPAMMEVVNKASKRQPVEEKMIQKFNYTIKRSDVHSLTGLNWLNDEVINFYMSLIMQRSKENSRLPKTYGFSTFFYLKLGTSGFTGVKRWTKKIDLFGYDLVIIPVHLKMHWCLAAIDMVNKTINYYDSMGTTNDQCLKRLEDYITNEHKDKKGQALKIEEWTKNNVKDIPHQMNGSDCGVFSCTFAEFLARRSKFTFEQNDMPYIRQKMIYEIVTGTLLT